MMNIGLLKRRLKRGEVIIRDGAAGTELQKRGIRTELPLWSARALIEDPKLVQALHADYINAGAEIITTVTFRTQRSVLDKAGLGDKTEYYTKLACKCAQDAVKNSGKEIFIAGSMAPLEDCYEPSLVPDNLTLSKIHSEHARALVDGGADFIHIETMNSIREAKIAAKAAKNAGAEIVVSFVCNEKGLLSGESIQNAVTELSQVKPLAIGINCCRPWIVDKILRNLLNYTTIPVIVYANGEGFPHDDYGWKFRGNMSPLRYAGYAKKWVEQGVQIIGGCCGTSPEYIKEIKRVLSD